MSRLRKTPAFHREVQRISAGIGSSQKTVRIDEQDSELRVLLLQHVTKRFDSPVVVSVPTAPDQVERVALDVGAQLGRDALREVDDRLCKQPHEALTVLAEYLGDRPLVVDGRDLVGNLGIEADEAFTHAMKAQLDLLAEFFDKHATVIAIAQHPRQRFDEEDAPLELESEESRSGAHAWKVFGANTVNYQLWLSLCALQGTPADADIPQYLPSADKLRTQISKALAGREATLLSYLCTHERTLPREIVGTLSLTPAVDCGVQLGLWHADERSLWVTRDWCRWWREAETPSRRNRYHLHLAEAFSEESRSGEPATFGPATLEAHRHFALAGDDERAKQCARYGGGMLVARARGLSHDKKYLDAAALYSFVANNAKAGELPVPKELQAYAIHYMHYNRNRAVEHGAPLDETIVGYERARDIWPENALFWSRLVRAYFYARQPARALQALAAAHKRVPDHSNKNSVLVARTTNGLLRSNEHLLDAALVWGGYRCRNQYEFSIFEILRTRLSEGWETKWLRIPNGPELVFHRLVRVQLEYLQNKRSWIAEVPEIDASEAGDRPVDALIAMIDGLREETKNLVRAFTHRLSAEERLRKQRLLATIDIVASRLDAAVPEHVWILGALESSGKEWTFRSHNDICSPLSVEFEVEFDTHPRFARFATDAVGRPVGPVLEFSEPFRGSARDLWAEWRRKLSGGG